MAAVSGRTVAVALGIDLAIGVACLTLFSVLRIIRPTNRYYDPRTYYGASSTRRTGSSTTAAQAALGAAALDAHNASSSSTPAAVAGLQSSSSSDGNEHDANQAAVDNSSASATTRTPSLLFPSPSPLAPPGVSGMPLPGSPLPPVLPKTLLTWVIPLLRLSEARVIAAVGLDVAMLLRFIRFALKLLLFLMVWCIGVVLPVNYSANNLAGMSHNLANVTHTPAVLQGLSGTNNMLYNSSYNNFTVINNVTNTTPKLQVAAAPENSPAPAAAGASPTPTPATFLGSLFPNLTSLNIPGPTVPRDSSSSNGSGSSSSGGRVQLGAGDLSTLAYQTTGEYTVASDLDLFSMANIPAGSPLLWLHLASVYVVTAITLKLLWSATSDALRVYLHHLASSSMNLDSASHTALLTDIPGIPRGTMIEKVLHNPLFVLLPGNMKRKLTTVWFQIFKIDPATGKPHGKDKQLGSTAATAAAAAAATADAISSSSTVQQQQQQQQQQNGVYGPAPVAEGVDRSSNADAAGQNTEAAVRIHIAPLTAAAAAGQHSSLSVRDSAVDYDQAAATAAEAAALDSNMSQHKGDSKHAGLRHRHKPSSSSSSSTGPYPQQQQQWRPLVLRNDTALAGAVMAQAQHRIEAGVGGVGMFSDEWRRAARVLGQGINIEEFVKREFEDVYGAHNIVAVNIVNYSPKTAKLIQQYNNTRIALEDLLDHYGAQLHKAAAAAGRLKKKSSVLRRHTITTTMQPIGIRKLPWPKELSKKKHSKHSKDQSAAAAAAPINIAEGVSTHSSTAAGDGAAADASPLPQAIPAAVADAPAGVDGSSSSNVAVNDSWQQQGQQQQQVPSHQINISAPPSEASLPLSSSVISKYSMLNNTMQRLESHYIDFADDSSIASSSVWGGSSITYGPAAAARPDPVGSAVTPPAAAAAVAEGVGSSGSRSSSNVKLNSRLSRVTSGDTELEHGDDAMIAAAAAAAAGAASAAAAATQTTASSNQLNQHSHNSSASYGHCNADNSSSSSSSTANSGGSSSSGRRCLCFPAAAARGDACDVLLARLELLHQQLEAAQDEAAAQPMPSAFVTFRTRAALTSAVSSYHVAEAGVWKLTAAPPPDSLNWSKLGLRYWEIGVRRGFVYTMLIVLALFYFVPVAAVQSILQLERLQAVPVISTLVSLPIIHSLLLGVLPGLALRIFVLLLPLILYALNRRAGPVSDGQLDGWVATHFFIMQVVIVFFASFIAGSLLNQVNVLFTEGAGPVLDRLGAGAPQTANFFILYIIFTAFIGRSWALLRPWGLLMTSIRALAARNRGRSGKRRALLVGTYRMFGPSVVEHSMILLLGLIFSVIAPLVLAAAFVFFCMASVVESYNWVWVFRRPYEGGGRLWKQLFRHVFVALYIFQAIMGALLIVKRFVYVPLLLPLFLITVLVQHIGSKLLQRSWDVLSVRAAHELDVQDRQEALQALQFWKRAKGTGRSAEQLNASQHQPHQQIFKVRSRPEIFAEAAAQIAESMAPRTRSDGDLSAELRHASLTSHLDVDLNDDVDDEWSKAVEDVCRSQTAVWGSMYRPTAVQLLEIAPVLHEQLRERVAAMQARLAAHNAAAKLERAMAVAAREAASRV